MRCKRSAAFLGLLGLIASLTTAACGGDEVPDDVIDRETFISTYVDLRVTAVQSEDLRLPGERRDSILAAHGVDAESLLRFADVHGRDLDFMAEIWNEVERRLGEASPSQGAG